MRRVGQLLKTGLWPIIVVGLSTVAVTRDTRRMTVLFDESHGQRFLIEKVGPLHLSGLADLFRQQGFRVEAGRQGITEKRLAGVDVVVMSGPFAPLTAAELDAITHFLSMGGRLCVMLHIAPPVAPLIHRLDVAVSNGIVFEQEQIIANNALDFYITRFTPHALTAGLERFAVYGGWALMNTGGNAAIIAQTSPGAWVDLNWDRTFTPGDARQSFGLVVAGHYGHGHFAILGDDAIFQNKFLQAGNRQLGQNLVKWLRQP